VKEPLSAIATKVWSNSESRRDMEGTILTMLITDCGFIRFSYSSAHGKIAAMLSDLPSLLNRFDDPPMTLRGVLGGLGLLIALLLAVRHGPALLAAAPYLLISLLVLGPLVWFAGRYAGRAKLAPARGPMVGNPDPMIPAAAGALMRKRPVAETSSRRPPFGRRLPPARIGCPTLLCSSLRSRLRTSRRIP
jgi:hypothetical protein